MKILVGCLTSAGLLLATAAQAQTLPPMRGDVVDVVRVSDFGELGPYDAGPYASMPRVYAAAPRYGYAPAVLPPQEVYAILREAGFSPLGVPQQRGLVYTVSVIDRDGEDGRMVIDARSGRILRFMPAYQLGNRMNDETVTRYGPEASLPTLPQYRRPPFDPAAAGASAVRKAVPGPKLANRTPAAVPLPKSPPVRAVATPAKPVAADKSVATDKPVAQKPAEPAAAPAPAPVQQSAVTEPKPAEVKTPETTGAAPAAKPDATPPTVAPVATEAKPAEPGKPTDTPPVQGVE